MFEISSSRNVFNSCKRVNATSHLLANVSLTSARTTTKNGLPHRFGCRNRKSLRRHKHNFVSPMVDVKHSMLQMPRCFLHDQTRLNCPETTKAMWFCRSLQLDQHATLILGTWPGPEADRSNMPTSQDNDAPHRILRARESR